MRPLFHQEPPIPSRLALLRWASPDSVLALPVKDNELQHYWLSSYIFGPKLRYVSVF